MVTKILGHQPYDENDDDDDHDDNIKGKKHDR